MKTHIKITTKAITSLIMLLFVCYLNAQQQTHTNQVTTFELSAPELQTTKKIWVYLPKNYQTTKKKFSVLYMHDAQNLFDSKTSFAGEWQIDETLDSLNAQTIVVGIEHGNEKRIEELTPFFNPKYGGGKADLYLQFIVKTLKPHIDLAYRTKKDAKNTAIFGSSLGGSFSFYAMLRYPKIFGKVGAFSPAFWINPELYELLKMAPKLKNKCYFLCGDAESENMVMDLNKMYQILDKNRCSCLHLSKKVIVKGGQHNEKLWRDGFAKAYIWLMN